MGEGFDTKSDIKSSVGGASKADHGGDLAKGVGVDLNGIASGMGDVASSLVSSAVDVASSVASGAVSVATELASGAVKLSMNAVSTAADNSGGLDKSYTYGHDGFYPEDGGNPLPSENGTGSSDYGTEYTNDDIRTSLDGSEGEDLNKFAKDGGTKQSDSAQLDATLENFQDDRWNDLSLEDQKQAMTDLADHVAVDTGNKNPPEIIFSDDMPDGTYGGYNPATNTIEINENMLDDSAEAADTITHEMWHAYQEQAANDPNNPRAQEYQEGFDNYISPEYDFEGYENQMVEAEAREYAQGFKDRLAGMKGTG